MSVAEREEKMGLGRRSVAGFEDELRISLKPVIALLWILGLALASAGDFYPDSSFGFRVVQFALLLCLLSATAWLIDAWKPWIGRCFVIIALIALIHLGSSWLSVPGFLVLIAIPVALAAALISITAATVAALGETGLLLLLPEYLAAGLDGSAIAVVLVGIWAVLGIMYAVYNPVFKITRWSWEYYQRVRNLLEEARDRKVELEQALEDLAQANRQLTRLNMLAQGLRQAAEDARTAKEHFVANVSHELRTPLNMIIGFSEMILQSPETYGSKIPPALLADLAVINRNAEHLADLVDDVLDLSQIETQQTVLTKEHVQLHEIVENVAVAVHPLFDSKGLYLETRVPEDLPPVFCDRTRVREVLLNLLSNAGRFTERGGVRVRIWREGNDVVVAVADTGAGIAAQDLGKLFQPFQQLDSTIRRRYGGTGLGLSISKRFIELHGGKIWVESKEGIGTTFFFRLPFSLPMSMKGGFSRWIDPHWEYVERTHPPMAPRAVIHPRFVVLEGGESLQRLLTRYVDGVEVVPVSSLEQALEELSRIPSQALLINDASVSDALERLNSAVTLPSGTPAFICSVPGVQEASAALGASDCLVKPVSRETLLGALDRLQLGEGTILIVDDEPDALHLFGRMLASSGRGYRVLLARDGREAMNVLHECRPDVILLDLIMPNMDGFQLLEARSQDPALRDIPVLVISAQDPAGQPIVSSALAVTQGSGLSVRQLLTSIEALSRTLSVVSQAGDPASTEASPD